MSQKVLEIAKSGIEGNHSGVESTLSCADLAKSSNSDESLKDEKT